MSERLIDELRRLSPSAASGWARRCVDGRIEDVAAFAHVAPDRWRVRHDSGDEIVVVGPSAWRRPGPRRPWENTVAANGAGVHHNGWIRGMLTPRLLGPLADPGARVVSRDDRPDGSTRLEIVHQDPVPGRVVAEVAPAGYLTRLTGAEDGRSVVLEMVADLTTTPAAEVFDPEVPWGPPAGEFPA